MIVKDCLFIADESVSEITEKITGSLKKQGITFNYQHIDLRDEKYFIPSPEDPDKSVLSFDKIKSEINEKFIDVRFDIVACDFNYAGDPIDGLRIIKWLKNESENKKYRIRRAAFILYSSEQEKLIQKTNSIEELTKLIRLKIDDFVERQSLAEQITKKMSEIISEETPTIILELEKYESLTFKSVYPQFHGYTLGLIAQEIEKQTYHGLNFRKSLLELTIAHLIEINE